MKKTTLETDIKKAIKTYLQYTGWYVFNILQGLGAHKGISDFIAVKNGRTLFLEVKKPGGKQSVNQEEFEREIIQHGGEYYVVCSIDDVEKL